MTQWPFGIKHCYEFLSHITIHICHLTGVSRNIFSFPGFKVAGSVYPSTWIAANPFTVPADSVSIVRQRIRQFFDEPRRLLGGGTREFMDSSWHMPYYNSHHKGDRILIEMHQAGERFLFECNWWDSRVEDVDGGKEIALFLQKGISRFD